MAFLSLYLLFSFSFLSAAAQTENAEDVFIIQGKLVNCPEPFLRIIFYNEYGRTYVMDTLHLDAEGNFYLETRKLKYPQRTSIQHNRINIRNILVAPGYNLHLTGDASDARTLAKTLKITGVGAEINQYAIALTKAHAELNDTTEYWTLGAEDLAAYASKKTLLADSVAAAVLQKKPVNDPYYGHFVEMIGLDRQFIELFYLLTFVNEHPLSYQESVNFMKKYADAQLLNNFSRAEHLISNDYRSYALNEYVKYHNILDARKDSAIVKEKNYAARKAGEILNGLVKDYYMHLTATASVDLVKSLERLSGLRERMQPYIDQIANEDYLADVERQYEEKEKMLRLTQVGQPAPVFTLASDQKKEYSLTDFRGKVVYLDFWASWCKPCREETPDFKKLYEKYKNDERIAFVGIAVSDAESDWRRALKEDQPAWLQLYDGAGFAKRAYAAIAIPRFVLIDKEGKIVTFDAPPPSAGEKLEALLQAEMEK